MLSLEPDTTLMVGARAGGPQLLGAQAAHLAFLKAAHSSLDWKRTTLHSNNCINHVLIPAVLKTWLYAAGLQYRKQLPRSMLHRQSAGTGTLAVNENNRQP
jgi:hypothetical protein